MCTLVHLITEMLQCHWSIDHTFKFYIIPEEKRKERNLSNHRASFWNKQPIGFQPARHEILNL